MSQLATSTPTLYGLLIGVRDLQTSVAFYREVLGLQIRQHDGQVAMLGRSGDAPVVSLREASSRAIHPGRGARAVFWEVDTLERLDALEAWLRARGAFSGRYRRTKNTTTVVGLDPDLLPLAFTVTTHRSHLGLSDLTKIPALACELDS